MTDNDIKSGICENAPQLISQCMDYINLTVFFSINLAAFNPLFDTKDTSFRIILRGFILKY